MTAAIYLISYAAFPLFGFLLSAYPISRIESRAARIAYAFLAGGFLLTVEATLFSTFGWRWSIAALSVPILAAAAGVALRRPRVPHPSPSTWTTVGWIAMALVVVAVLHFLLEILTTRAVNPDFTLFWGVKSVHFARARAIDAAFLGSRYPPPRPEYPPLVPIVQAWGLLFSRKMPWLSAAAMSAAWFAATIPVVYWGLRRVRRANSSAAGVAFWALSLSASLAYSAAGGNAETMVVAYLTVAGVALVVEPRPAGLAVAAASFAAAALTKAEALLWIVAVIAGVGLRDAIRRDRRGITRVAVLSASAAAGLGLWFLFEWRHGLALSTHALTPGKLLFENAPVVARAVFLSLSNGTWGLSWAIPAGVILFVALRSPRRLVAVLPLLAATPMFFAFVFYLYLQYTHGAELHIAWEVPRISQPVQSLFIVAAVMLSIGEDERNVNRGQTDVVPQ